MRKNGQKWWIYSRYISKIESLRFADALYLELKDNILSVNIYSQSLICIVVWDWKLSCKLKAYKAVFFLIEV